MADYLTESKTGLSVGSVNVWPKTNKLNLFDDYKWKHVKLTLVAQFSYPLFFYLIQHDISP